MNDKAISQQADPETKSARMDFVMKTKWRKATSRSGMAILIVSLLSPIAVAQSYLDQLESIVKKFGEEQSSETPSEELPLPSDSPRQRQQVLAQSEKQGAESQSDQAQSTSPV